MGEGSRSLLRVRTCDASSRSSRRFSRSPARWEFMKTRSRSYDLRGKVLSFDLKWRETAFRDSPIARSLG